MLDGGTVTPAENANNINAYLAWMHVMRAKPTRSEPLQAGGFHRGDSLQRTAEAGPAPRLDLTDDERVPIAGDDVDFSDITPPVAIKNDKPHRLQMPDGDVLAVPTQRVLRSHSRITSTGERVGAENSAEVRMVDLWMTSAMREA
jgi:hypothetical protein